MEPCEHKLLQLMQGCFGREKRYANAVPELYRFTFFGRAVNIRVNSYAFLTATTNSLVNL